MKNALAQANPAPSTKRFAYAVSPVPIRKSIAKSRVMEIHRAANDLVLRRGCFGWRTDRMKRVPFHECFESAVQSEPDA
jgi:hypothetical protein